MDDDLRIGEVQWHSSEEDGGPDVGILLRLSEDHKLWVGELLDAEGGGFGFILYGPEDERRLFNTEEYCEVRQLFEDYIAAAIRELREARDYYAGLYADRCGQLLAATAPIAGE